MGKNICPGCGALYNGKKCPKCFFKPMDTEFIRSKPANQDGNPERRFLGDSFAKNKQKTTLRSFAGFLIILALIALLLPALRNWGLTLETREASQSVSQTLP